MAGCRTRAIPVADLGRNRTALVRRRFALPWSACWKRKSGACLSDDERYALANCDAADLLALLVAADTLRRELVGNIVSYVVNRNINFTNICFVGCKFCAFSRGPREGRLLFSFARRYGPQK